MTPPIGLLTPVKAAIGQWLVEFYGQFQPDTPANTEWASRGAVHAMAWAPARMVDHADEMLSNWKRNDNSGKKSTSAYLPVMILAVGAGYAEAPPEVGRSSTDFIPISFPDDTLQRSFRVKVMTLDLRAQIVIMADEPISTASMMAQLSAWVNSRYKIYAPFVFGDFTTTWPATVILNDKIGVPDEIGEQLTVVAMDLTIRATVPLFKGPGPTDRTDGNTPPGFAVVNSVTNRHDMTLGPPTGVSAEEWAEFARLVTWSDGPPQVVLAPVAAEV